MRENVNDRNKHSLGAARHEARGIALKILFEADLTPHGPLDILARYMEDESIAQAQREYSEQLVQGVAATRDEIDVLITEAAPAFPVDQLPVVDRNVLRVAVYELREGSDVPVKAAINEAVEIAKEFGGENSGKFVNGVLGTIAGNRTSSGGRDES